MVRSDGETQAGIRFGRFLFRIPFVHYRLERVELLEGLIMCAACMSAIPILQQILGIPYELAWSMVIVNGILYVLHSLLGDPVVPGWITPAIPVTTAYLLEFNVGEERIKALIALQILVAVAFLFMGVTGLAKKIVNGIPTSIKSGILLGAGFSAVFGEFAVGGRMGLYTWTILISGVVMFYTTYSAHFRRLRLQSKIINMIANWGMVPAFLVAVFVGPLLGEIQAPELTIGTIFKIPDIAGILQYSVFHVGFPEASYFIQGIATAVVIYIIAFGDFITAGALVSDAAVLREDETVDLDPNRSNLVCGIRNAIQAFICPYPNLCGPMWSGAYAVVVQRYKEGRKAMDSLVGGAASFRIGTLLGVMLIPINGLLQYSLPVALSLMMLIQGYICVSLAMAFAKTDNDRGIAGIMGAVLAAKGAAWGLLVGFAIYFILSDRKKVEGKAE